MSFNYPSLGELASLGAAFIWAISTTLYRVYGQSLHPAWLTVFKGFIASVLLVLTVIFTGGFQISSLSAFLLLALSGVIGISLGDTAYFSAFPKIGASLTAAIQCLVPPLTAVAAWLFLQESLNLSQISGLCVTCFAIAILVLSEGGYVSKGNRAADRGFKIGVLLAVGAAFCQATGVIIARGPLEGLSAAEGAAHRIVMSLFVLIIWERFAGRLQLTGLGVKFVRTPNFFKIFLASVLGTFIGLMLMVYGMTHAPVGIALTLNSSYPIWVVCIEVLFFGRKLKLATLGLQVLAIFGIFLMAYN